MSIRVRYAPSPTGSPHVGNIRDALFKHLLAKGKGGTNILRIEDTDRNRYVEGAETDIFESLRWIGVEWQEGPDVGGEFGPYRQSERKDAGIYQRWIEVLLEQGAAYRAFETPEELEEMREYQQVNRQPVGYFGGAWRDAGAAEVDKALTAGRPFVIRQRMPRGKTIAIDDAIRGRIEWTSDDVDDTVLIKADGMPTYHFAAMVDDHLMRITHIIRGEEWISSAPKHAELFDAFGWERPVFVHCPVIKGKDGKKLSKRHGDTRCLDFRAAGYLPQALANFIALIGWSPGGDRELMSMPELEEAFDLEGLQPSPGVFDMDKLNWMNGHYIRELPSESLFSALREFTAAPDTRAYWLGPEQPERHAIGRSLELLGEGLTNDPRYAAEVVCLERERVQTLAEFGPASSFFFEQFPEIEPKAREKWLSQEQSMEVLRHFSGWLEGMASAGVEECEAEVRAYAEAHGLEKLGPVVHPLRVALTGRTVGPGLFELMSVLGPARMRERLGRVIESRP